MTTFSVHVKTWCTKDVRIIDVYQDPDTVDYLPASGLSPSDWSKNLESYNSVFGKEFAVNLEDSKKLCSEWKNRRFRVDSDPMIMDKFGYCLIYRETLPDTPHQWNQSQ